jgi:hypothetical protein
LGQVTDTSEVITIGAVALLVVKEAFSMVRAARHRNGHGKPDPSTVTKETAPEFWLLQNEMKASIARSEEMLRRIHDEVLDDRVRRHHR